MAKTPITDGWNTVKEWYKSKTIIGVIIASIGLVLQVFWKDVNLKETVDVVIESGDELALGIDNVYGLILEVIGLAVVLWGRIKAKSKII